MSARIDEQQVGFRSLKRDELLLMHRWLNSGPAFEWYGSRTQSMEEIETKYLPRIDGRDPVHALALIYRGQPIGYLQWYRLRDEPEYALDGEDGTDAAAIDLFIGEPKLIGRGFGTAVLRKVLAEVVFAEPDIRRCYIDPNPANARAIRAYEKAGFVYLKTIENAWEGEPAYLMAVDRSAVGGEIAGASADDPDRDQHQE
jgi:RimJ/RimL family protein N-acetyltransferase